MSGLPLLDGSLSGGRLLVLLAFLATALAFEFVNGFHDTANAVATVIYTRSLAPRKAVVWSGLCNFMGVHLGGTLVAFSIVNLLPVEMLVSIGSGRSMAMMLALLTAAMVWNLGTWYLGLPASSSHTLIGAILGVGLANSLLSGQSLGAGVNWTKAIEIGLSLLISPLIGFCLAALLLLVLRAVVRDRAIDHAPGGDDAPPFWIRAVLLTTCTGVSVAHGSNDGQKGIGLIMLILIAFMPARYAINSAYTERHAAEAVRAVDCLEEALGQTAPNPKAVDTKQSVALIHDMHRIFEQAGRGAELSPSERWQLRTDVIELDRGTKQLEAGLKKARARPDLQLAARKCRAELRKVTDYAPDWVTAAVALALGVGTMVGWKRVVTTVGERIGKAHLTYAQGMSAEIVAMGTISLADIAGLPVSTTHVLSSGIAGTMAAARFGVQHRTVRNIALAWLLTLPATMILGGGLYLAFRGLGS